MAKRICRGLDALLAENHRKRRGDNGFKACRIEPNLKQVRKTFDAESIAELAESIKEHGLIQPIVVRKGKNGFYQIIAGERRWRACKMAGLAEVPVIIRDFDDKSSSLVALVENLQREDLNPVEEAFGYQNLMETYGFTQEEVARKVGKSRPAIANALRILFPDAILVVKKGELSAGHARTILPLAGVINENQLTELAERIINEGLSVRETENLVKATLENKNAKKNAYTFSPVKSEYYKRLESDALLTLGRRITHYTSESKRSMAAWPIRTPEDLKTLLISLAQGFF